MNKRIK